MIKYFTIEDLLKHYLQKKFHTLEYIDGQGILHENFFLIPIGFLCVFSGLISFITVGITTLISKLKNRNS